MKLTLELVPQSSFYQNVRTILTESQWKVICSKVYSKNYYLCAICGGVGDAHPVEAHEIWSYDDKNLIQCLTDIVSLCPMCHSTKHYGLSIIQGREQLVFEHLMKVNKLTHKKAKDYVKKSFELWSKRSQKKWKIDFSHLKEYGIDVK